MSESLAKTKVTKEIQRGDTEIVQRCSEWRSQNEPIPKKPKLAEGSEGHPSQGVSVDMLILT